MSHSKPEISVCVCTFRRPAALLRLLRSLLRLDPSTPTREVVVVDNDAARSGAPSVAAARAEGAAIGYVCEPQRGIARARNRAVAAARGRWIAFIDDDEEADPSWLLHLWREVTHREADAGVGPVVPRFGAAAPRWLVDGGFFERHRFPTGTVLHAGYTRTGNALVGRQALSSLAGPFDERFDLTGGEDNDLFARIIARGGRVIAVDTAVVYEHVGLPRTTMRWLLRRRFFVGVSMARLDQTVGRADPTLRRRVRLLAAVLANGGRGLLLFPAARVRGFGLLLAAARDLGRLAFLHGRTFRPYASAPDVESAGAPPSERAA
jgi:succinoglycan biosynthesis protein ExoM